MGATRSASETARRTYKEFLKNIKKNWDAFIESASHLFFGRLSYDHVRLDDWRKYFTDIIPCSAGKGAWMYGVAGHPSGRVYATTDMGNFFRSDDGGKTFVAVGQNDFYLDVFHIAINPNNPDHIILSCANGIFVSYDGGVTTKRGRLAVGKYLEYGALGDHGAFRAVPESKRGGETSAWNFQGWGQFNDYTNWTSDRWLGTAGRYSGNSIPRIQAFGPIFSQDLFFSGYKTIDYKASFDAHQPSNNLAVAQNYILAGRHNKLGNFWRDCGYFNWASMGVYRNTNNRYTQHTDYDIPFSEQIRSDFAEGRVAYRRRGRPIPESGSNTDASNISDLFFISNSLSKPFNSSYLNFSMFVRAAFAPSNPNIVYAISGYSPRRFLEFGYGNYTGFTNVSRTTPPDIIPDDTNPNRTLKDQTQWWSMSFIWVSFDGGESWSLLGHTVGMWRPPSTSSGTPPDWWKDLFQDYTSGRPTFTSGGLPNVDKRITTGSGANNILSDPFWHLVNNALSEGNDLSLSFTWSGSAANGNPYAPGILMYDLAVDPNDPFVVMLSCNDMFASFTYGSKLSFSSNDSMGITTHPQRTLRPYWTGGLIRIEINRVNLPVDPQNTDLPITSVGSNASGLLSLIYTGELCSIDSNYTWYSSKARYMTNLGTNRRNIRNTNDPIWLDKIDLHDVIVENGVIEWKQAVYEATRTVGQTYLMRTVKRGYPQTAAMIAFDWVANNSLSDSWAFHTRNHFIHNGILALQWRSDGLWVTQIPRWRLLRNNMNNPVTYTLQSVSGKTYYIFECSPMIAKLEFNGKTLSSVTPIRSYHQETYRIHPNTNDWQDYLSAYNMTNTTFTTAANAPHRAMKYLYAILGNGDSNHYQSLHTSEENYAPVLELPSYFVNYWAWEQFLRLETERMNQNRFVRYNNIFTSNISNYDGQNLGTDIPFYSLMPLNANLLIGPYSSFIIFPICFIVDDNYIFVGQTPSRGGGFLQRSYTNDNPGSLAVRSRRHAPFLILDRSSPNGCLIAIQSKATANPSASNKALNALVYLKDRLSPPFPFPVFYSNTNHSFEFDDFGFASEAALDNVSYYNASLIKKSPQKYVLILSQLTNGVRYEIDFERRTCFFNFLESSPNTSQSKNSKYPMLSALESSTRRIYMASYKKLNQLGSTYLDTMHSVITNNFDSQANSALHIWEKCSGFEEAASARTRWLSESNAVAYWDEHQCNAFVLAEGSAFVNRFVERILLQFSRAKTFSFIYDTSVEGSNTSISYTTFRSGLSVLGDDSEYVYYAFQYYLPKNQPQNGYFVGVLRISKDLLLRPESLGEWFDGLHPLGFLKHDGNRWYWSRDINRHIQILTPVGRIRRLNWAQPDPNAPHYLASADDMGPDDFDMGAASIMPCMIFGRNDSSHGRVYGQVVEDGDDTIIYLYVGSEIGGNATNQTHAQSMVAPTTNNYSLAQSNRKAFMVDGNNNIAYNQSYGQMFNPKIYRLKVSKSRIYTGYMYPLHPTNNRQYIQFDFVNPFDGSLECLNDDTYYELTYHPDVLSSEVVGEETKFYIESNNIDQLTLWSNHRWGYWYRHANQINANDPNNANLVGIRYNPDTRSDEPTKRADNSVFYVARFSKINTPRARLYTHVFAVRYKVNSSNNAPYPDFNDIRSGWVEWDVPGFLWDNLGGITNLGRPFVVDPFKKGEKNRLLISAAIAFPHSTPNPAISNNEPLGLYSTSATDITWRTILFDVRREIVGGTPVWKWYALFPGGLLYFTTPFYKPGLPNLPSGTTRFESGRTLYPDQYADTVCYDILERDGFKVKVNPSPISIGDGSVDLLGRYRVSTSGNYEAVSFINFAGLPYLPFVLTLNRAPGLAVGKLRNSTTHPSLKEIDVYVGYSSFTLPIDVACMFGVQNSFHVMPSPLVFRLLGNLTTSSSYNDNITNNIRSLGSKLFATRDFKPNGYYHTLASRDHRFHVNKQRFLLCPANPIVRITIKDVPEYNLLGGTSSTNYIPIDPVNTPSTNRISILDDFRIVLENTSVDAFDGVLVHCTKDILFAAYPTKDFEPNTPYNNHLFVSVNRGENWVAIKIPFITNGFSNLDIHPKTFDFIICGQAYPMVFRSVGYREFVRRLRNIRSSDRLPLRRYELAGRKR
jgi:hypothetical protein